MVHPFRCVCGDELRKLRFAVEAVRGMMREGTLWAVFRLVIGLDESLGGGSLFLSPAKTTLRRAHPAEGWVFHYLMVGDIPVDVCPECCS